MRLTGSLLEPLADGTVALRPATVQIAGDRIEHVEPADGVPDGAPIIAPGLIDAHLHLPQFDSIGADGLALLDWLDRVVFPAEIRWADADYAAAMSDRVATQLLACGTTGVCAYATVHHEATRRAMRVLADRGLRGLVGQVLMDREAPAELTRPAARLIDEAASLRAVGRIEPGVTPRFAIACTPELLGAAGDLARESGLAVQTHLAETRAECDRVAELFGGARYADVYDDAGLLSPRAVLAHAVHLDDRDRRTLADAGSTVAHCPAANLFLRSGAMNLAATRAAGVPVALGSDVAGGPDRSMVRVGRAMIETAKTLGHEPPSPAQAWHAITRGNADALAWPDAGRLEPGAAADLVVIEPDVPWRRAPDPLGLLLYAWDDRWITNTIAAGRVAYQA